MVSGHHSFLHSITTLEKLLPGPLACHIFFHSITTLEKLPQDIYFNTASFAKIIIICENNDSLENNERFNVDVRQGSEYA